ncbi:MAG: hypothetical protein M3N29_00220 [Chloroflexota bacterium]|nr:hypothetical protein [Chloroflexota bacterium]
MSGSAGQSFAAFAAPSVELILTGQANDYVAKGLSGGWVVLRPEAELLERAAELAICGNTCLYGATAGRLHVVGRAGMRFAVRNSGASAVVEGVGAHACEYMTGGVVVVLGPVGRNMGAGMTGGRVYLWDPAGERIAAIDRDSVAAMQLSAAVDSRADGGGIVDELRELLEGQRAAGSLLARRLLDDRSRLGEQFWLIEPLPVIEAASATADGHPPPIARTVRG